MNVQQNSIAQRVALAAFAGCLVLGIAGCNGCNSANPAASTSSPTADNGQDPAMANMSDDSDSPAGTTQPTQVMGATSTYQGTQAGESYPQGQQPAYDDANYDEAPTDQQAVYSDQAPPPLPEYDQPPAPADNDLWTPGYWAYGNGGYYWVPGAWVAAPYYGALWTPPYWGYTNRHYYFHHGYWGPHVGFYGGVNYGFGYIGTGFWGGYWRGHDFYYNRAVTRVGPSFHGNVYERNVVYNNVHYGMQPSIRVAFNGGPGGIDRRPAAFEVAAMHEHHEAPLAVQTQNHQAAAQNRAQFFSTNHGRPAEVAANHAFGNPGGIRATPADVHPGRPGFNGTPAANHPEAGGVRPGEPNGFHGAPQQPHPAPNLPGAQGGVRPNEQPGPMNRPGMPGGQGGYRSGAEHNQPMQPQANHVNPQPAAQPQFNRPEQPMQHAAPAQTGHPEFHAATPQPMHQAPAPQQMHQAPAPQQMRQAPAPQQMHQAPAPQQLRQAPAPQQMHEAPQQHAAPAPQQHEAPHAAPAPQQHEAPHPAAPAAPGGGGHPEGDHHH